MLFDELDATMRVFETAHDHCVLPGLWMVVRLDGRNFTRLVRELHPFEAPFDPRFRDLMVATTRHLMGVSQSNVGLTHIPLLCDKHHRAAFIGAKPPTHGMHLRLADQETL